MRESRIRRIIIASLLVLISVGFILIDQFFPGLLTAGARNLFAMSSGTENSLAVVIVTQTSSAVPSPSPEPTVKPTVQRPPPTATQFLVPTPIGAESLEIAFASTRSGVSQIYLTNLLGTSLTQLTKVDEGACQPAWSPDGLRLIFISPCKFKNDSYPDSSLYVINADGSGLAHLPSIPGGDFEPDWSPDGKKIAFTSLRTGHMQIYVYDLETNIVTRLTHTPFGTATRQPDWSTDGKQIVYSYRRNSNAYQIWLMTSSGRDQTPLVVSGNNYSDTLPAWSQDGKVILFHERPTDRFGFPDLMMISFEPDARPVKLNLGILSIDDIAFSPEGFWLAFEGSGDHGSDIYYMTVTGANQTQLTDDQGDDFDPAWRPVKK